jgi:hypothetical protein
MFFHCDFLALKFVITTVDKERITEVISALPPPCFPWLISQRQGAKDAKIRQEK